MNLVSFSIKTKGMHNFTRRLTTVFSRFGFSERRTRRALYSVIESLEPYEAMPTFFIPAVVLRRHARLLAEIADHRAEVGIHGYVHTVLLSGYEKSLELFQAIECNAYTLRPSYFGEIVRIPTSIPDDEMLFDRLRLPDKEIGRIWSTIMQRVYELGGIYVLNLHPERALLCKRSLNDLLSFTLEQSLPIWVTSLVDVAQWWKERSQFGLHFEPLAAHRWQAQATCAPRATILARHVAIEDQPTARWHGVDFQVEAQRFIVNAPQCPCLGVSLQTSQDVEHFLLEQGYPFVRCSDQDAHTYTYFLDRPEGLGTTSQEHLQRKSALLKELEELETPLIYYGCWPMATAPLCP